MHRSGQQDMRAVSEEMARQILGSDLWKNADTVMLYMALKDEVPMDTLMRHAFSEGKQVVLPRCEDGNILPCLTNGFADLRPGTYGILEPEKHRIVAPGEIDLILAPGMAFGMGGERLGRGAGYYDRFLPGTRAVVLGVCAEAFLMPSLPLEEKDVRMHYVLTEKRLIPVAAVTDKESMQ